MPTFKYDKLVRDNIWRWHEENGHTVRGEILTDGALRQKLCDKLHEEADEVANADSRQELIEEIADVRQILDDLCAEQGISEDEVTTAQKAKLDRKGGFRGGRYIAMVTIPDEDDEWARYCRMSPEKYPEIKTAAMSSAPVFITGNQNKVDYLSRTLGIMLPHQKIDLDEIQSADPRAVLEHKVRQAYDILHQPVLVEDTSLSFNAFDGLPGPFVKFYVEAANGLESMCRMLDGFSDRTAYASAIYGYYDGQQMQTFEGRLDGSIADHPRGDGGYGWDKIFEPAGYGGLTRAELSAEDDLESYAKIRDLDGLRIFLKQQVR